MMMFTFSVLDRKYTFWVNLVQKIKTINFSWNLLTRLIWICRTENWDVHFSSFWLKIPLLGKFSPKGQNSIAKFTFSVFNRKYPFYTNLVQKNKMVSLSWNVMLRLNLNLKNSIVMFIFFCFGLVVKFFWKMCSKKLKSSAEADI